MLHTEQYTSSLRDKLIHQWELKTENQWPSMKFDKKTGEHKLIRDDIHHIIPQEFGGPHRWWNIHPLKFGKHHQGGVHGTNSPLKIFFEKTFLFIYLISPKS